VQNNGLTVVAPGLPEGEVAADGTIFITVVRGVGWLSRMDLRSRPHPAGPGLRTPEAQCLGRRTTHLSLTFGSVPQVEAWDAELGFRAVPAGPEPLLPPEQELLSLSGPGVVLTALKPAENCQGMVARVLNPTEGPAEAVLRWHLPLDGASAVRLDEQPAPSGDTALTLSDRSTVTVDVPPHALRSVRVEPVGSDGS
jgi:alpha-mannosidase